MKKYKKEIAMPISDAMEYLVKVMGSCKTEKQVEIAYGWANDVLDQYIGVLSVNRLEMCRCTLHTKKERQLQELITKKVWGRKKKGQAKSN